MDTFRIAVRGNASAASQIVNVYTCEVGVFATLTPADVLEYLDSIYTAGLLGAFNTAVVETDFIVEVPVAAHWQFRLGGDFIRPFTHSGDSCPFTVAAVVLGLTPTRRRGKKFLCGVPEAFQTGGIINDSAFATALVNFALTYITPFVLSSGHGTITPGVCHPDGTNFLAFNGSHVDSILGTQVRRKQGRGR